MPRRFRVPPCSAGRHAVMLAFPLPRYRFTPLVVVLPSLVGVLAFPPRPPWAHRVAVGLAVRAARLHRPPVAPPLRRGLLTRALARVGFPGLRTAARQLGRWCVPGLGRGPGLGPRDREMTALRAVRSARLVGRGVAGTPVQRVSWSPGPPGLPCWTFSEPGGLGPRWGCGRGEARCRRAGWWRCRSG